MTLTLASHYLLQVLLVLRPINVCWEQNAITVFAPKSYHYQQEQQSRHVASLAPTDFVLPQIVKTQEGYSAPNIRVYQQQFPQERYQ